MLLRIQKTHRVRAMLIAGAVLLLVAVPITIGIQAQSQTGAVAPAQDRSITTLRDLNQALIDISARVKPTVVTVSTERILRTRGGNPFASPFNDPLLEWFFGPQQQPREQEFRQRGLGSGVLVGADGRILTNNHVVEKADSIYVRTFDGKRFSAEVLGTDPKTDIAVIKIDAEDLPFLDIGDSDKLQVGEMVLAIGSPMSENLAYTVTQGIVSATGRSNVGLADYEDFIQTDAAINPGNSGGPLVNLDGKLIGINTAIASRTGGFQGIGFAVPSNMAVRIMNSLITEGRVVRGWLGISVQEIDERLADALGIRELGGALVGDVLRDSPAETAGLQPGDVIIALDGRPVKNSAQLRNHIASTPPGTAVNLSVIRNDDRKEIRVILGELPTEFAKSGGQGGYEDLFGFTIETFTRELADRYGLDRGLTGVMVTSLDPESNAYRQGLRQGDLIRALNRQQVQNEADFARLAGGLQKGDTVLLRIYRDGGGFFVAFNL